MNTQWNELSREVDNARLRTYVIKLYVNGKESTLAFPNNDTNWHSTKFDVAGYAFVDISRTPSVVHHNHTPTSIRLLMASQQVDLARMSVLTGVDYQLEAEEVTTSYEFLANNHIFTPDEARLRTIVNAINLGDIVLDSTPNDNKPNHIKSKWRINVKDGMVIGIQELTE